MQRSPDTPDSPPLDLSDAAVKKLISSAKKRGYVTHDQINALLSSEEVKSEQIGEILPKFSEMGINVVETEEAEPEDQVAREALEEGPESEDGELVEVRQRRAPAKAATKEPTERADDPVRMYLREMGTELLSREGEIAVAKRIEVGREAMIAGLCESPLTFQAIITWRDQLNEGKVFLRKTIDLTNPLPVGPDTKAPPAPVAIGPDGQPVLSQPGAPIIGVQPPQTPATAPATPFKPAGEHAEGEEFAAGRTMSESNLDDDDDMENWLSVVAIEAELKPKVIKTFDTVAGTYKRLRRLQEPTSSSSSKGYRSPPLRNASTKS